MEETKKNILTVVSKIIYLSYISLLVGTIFMMGLSYGQYKEEGQTLTDFIMQKKHLEYKTYEEQPQEAKDLFLMVRNIWFMVILNFLKIFIDMKIEPGRNFLDNPFFNKVKTEWRKLINEQDKL